MPVDLTVISLGAGVQSTTLLLMALEGLLGARPDAAIFADTQWEPQPVYDHLAWLDTVCAAHHFPIVRVTKGDLRADTLAASKGGGHYGFAAIPLFVRSPTGKSSGMIRRQCTLNYKILPVRRAIRALLGTQYPRGKHVEMWMGISLDEVTRMKPSRVQYIAHRYPLVEQRMTRKDCLRWLAERGYPRPPRSACIGCPLHNTEDWREIRAQPAAWADAVQFDEGIRNIPRITGEAFLHPSLRPLVAIDFTVVDSNEGSWDAECEGACGL